MARPSQWKYFTQGVVCILTDEFEGEVFVETRLFGVFIEEHDGTANPTMLQGLLTDAVAAEAHPGPS